MGQARLAGTRGHVALLPLSLFDFRAQRPQRLRRGHVLLDRDPVLEAWQVGHDLAAEADQESGEGQRHQRHDDGEQAFGYTQELEHGASAAVERAA